MYSSDPAAPAAPAPPAMNAPLLPEILLGSRPADQPELPLAAAGVQRTVWHSAYGPILIEVRGDEVYVNGARVRTLAELRRGDAPA